MKFNLSLLLAALITYLVLSCSGSDTDHQSLMAIQQTPVGLPNWVQEAASIRNDMIARALRSKISGQELSRIIQRNDATQFRIMLGYSEQEFTALAERLRSISAMALDERCLSGTLPLAPSNCNMCDLDGFAQKWDSFREDNRIRLPLDGEPSEVPVPDPNDKGVTCQWTMYVAALGLCTVTGNPVVYFLCATVALCRYCTGGWVTGLCRQPAD